MRGLGLEHRFIFLWAEEIDVSDDEAENLSFATALGRLREVWAA